MMYSVYVDALCQFAAPATVQDIHAKAIEMYRDRVKGDVSSARNALDRFVKMGKIERTGRGMYYAPVSCVDPLASLSNKLKAAEKEIAALKARIEELEA